MRFADIPGCQSLKETLISSFNRNHIAHAQLFHGQPGGIGLPLALAYVSYLMCEDKTESDSCGKCPACQKTDKYIHPDVHFFFPLAKKTKKEDEPDVGGVAKWRNFLQAKPYGNPEDWIVFSESENKQNQISKEDARQIIKTVSMKAFEGGMKILLIWCPERMHPAAANAILKVLEEPPENTIYLLVTYNYEGLLTTILSRTQHFLVPVLPAGEIKNYLMNKQGITEEKAQKAAAFAEGSMEKALSLVKTAEDLNFQDFQKWMQACYRADFQELSQQSEAFGQSGKSNQRSYMLYSLNILRNVIIYKGNPELVMAEGAERKFIANFGNTLQLDQLEKIYMELNESLFHLERNANPRITCMALSIRILQAIHSKTNA